MKKMAKNIVEELSGNEKERVLFYIDKGLQAKFKKFCNTKKIRMSGVVEKLIEKFLDDLKMEK